MKWDCIRPDFLSLSHQEQLALIKYTRNERRKRYVPPPKKTREKKATTEKAAKGKGKPATNAQIAAMLLDELKRRQDEGTQKA